MGSSALIKSLRNEIDKAIKETSISLEKKLIKQRLIEKLQKAKTELERNTID